MGLSIAEKEHRLFAQILSEFGFSDTGDVPLSAVLRAGIQTERHVREKAEADLATRTRERDEAQQERNEAIADLVNAKRDATENLVQFARSSQERATLGIRLDDAREALDALRLTLAQLEEDLRSVRGDPHYVAYYMEFADRLAALLALSDTEQ